MRQHTELFVNVNPSPVVVVDGPERDGVLEFFENQVRDSQDRERALVQEYTTAQAMFLQTGNELETLRHQAQDWLNREGDQARMVVQTCTQESNAARMQLGMIEQEADIMHNRGMRGLEERAMNVLHAKQEEIETIKKNYGQEERTCREMSEEGSRLVVKVSELEASNKQAAEQQSRRETEHAARENKLETGSREILRGMVTQISSMSESNVALRSEVRQECSERVALENVIAQMRQEFTQTRELHQDAIQECASLRQSLHEVLASQTKNERHVESWLDDFANQARSIQNAYETSMTHESAKRLQTPSQTNFTAPNTSFVMPPQSQNFPLLQGVNNTSSAPLSSSSWTEMFMKSPTSQRVTIAGQCGPPGLSQSASVGCGSLTTHRTSQVPQAHVAFAPSLVESSGCGSCVPQLRSVGDLRRDRVSLPKCLVQNDPNNPAKTLLAWESWILQCGLAVSSWLNDPSLGAEVWNSALSEATDVWNRWSVLSPLDKANMERSDGLMAGGFVVPSASNVEAVLRVELCDKLPDHVTRKCMVEQKVTVVQILTCAMKLLLPAFHTVRTALLDSCERPSTQKLLTFDSVLHSVREWLRVLRMTMSRYQIIPESRRLWIALQSRFQALADVNTTFSATITNHMQSTQIKTRQDIETVLGFAVALEAELSAFAQDVSAIAPQKRETPHDSNRNFPTGNPSSTKDTQSRNPQARNAEAKSSESSTPAATPCKFFGTAEGCKFGQMCRNTHPFVRPGMNLCFVCGSSSHVAKVCTRPRKGPGDKSTGSVERGQSRSRNQSRPDASQSRQRSNSRGGSRGRNDSRSNAPKNTSTSPRQAAANKTEPGPSPNPKSKAQAKVAVVRALSADASDPSVIQDAILDSGASHVTLPLTWISEEQRARSVPIDLCMAAGKSQASCIVDGEVFSRGVRRPLLPMGKLVDRTGIRVEWTSSALLLKARDDCGVWRVIVKTSMRQSMPHVSLSVLPGVREALKLCRKQARNLSYEQWSELLGEALFHGDPDSVTEFEQCGIGARNMEQVGSEAMHTWCDPAASKRHEEVIAQLSSVMEALSAMCVERGKHDQVSSGMCLEDPELETSTTFVGGESLDDSVLHFTEALPAVAGEEGSDEEHFSGSDLDEEQLFGSDFEVDSSFEGGVSEQTTTEGIESPNLPDYWSMCTGENMIPSHDLETFVRHIEDGHMPKLATCPICQLADGPPYVHKRLERSEVGKLSVDIAGPLSHDIGQNKYLMVGVFVALNTLASDVEESKMAPMKPRQRKKVKQQKELVLPFVRVLKSREGEEVAARIKSMIEEIESFVSPLLPSHVPSQPRVLHVHLQLGSSESGEIDSHVDELEALVSPLLPADKDSCILKLHTDRASEFLSSEVFRVLRDKNIFQTVTSPHSSASNGRAEAAIRVVKSVVRRLLLASNLPVFLWSFAASHAAQVLRALSLMKSGQKDVWKPKAFGSYVTLRKLGDAKRDFGPFEPRGVLGRLLLENLTSDRLCYVLDDVGKIHRGTSPSITFPGPIMTKGRSAISNAERYGWKAITLQNGHNAWLKDDVLALSPPLFVDAFDSDGQDMQAHSQGEFDEVDGDSVSDADLCICSCCASVAPFIVDHPQSQMAPEIVGCSDRFLLKQLCREIYNLVSQMTLPKMRARTNVYGAGLSPRGFLLGAFTRRGVGVTRATERATELTSKIHALAKLRLKDTPYASVYVSTTAGLPLHTDSNNFCHNDVICTGKFSGGRVFVEHPGGKPFRFNDEFVDGRMFSVKHQFLRFDPSQRHAVEPSRGHRVSIVFFSPRFLSKLSESDQHLLEQAGFRVREVINMQDSRRVVQPNISTQARLRSHECNLCEGDLSLDAKGRMDNCNMLDTSSLWSVWSHVDSIVGPASTDSSIVDPIVGPRSTDSSVGDSTTDDLIVGPLSTDSFIADSTIGSVGLRSRDDDVQAGYGQLSSENGALACQHFDLTDGDSENVEVCPDYRRRVRFSFPEVEQLVEFEAFGNMRPTGGHGKSSRTKRFEDEGSNALHGEVVLIQGEVSEDVLHHRAESFLAVHELKIIPKAEELDNLAKSIPISLEAVRTTRGEEREKWRTSLKKELDSLVAQRTFDSLPRSAKLGLPPARCVFTIKPTAEGVPKRKSRIVLCGNFLAPYSAPSTANLDSTVLRTTLHTAVHRGWLMGTLDIPTAFLNASLGDDREVMCQPPRILEEMKLIEPGTTWRLRKALYGLKEAPKLWESARDAAMEKFRFTCNGEQMCLVRSAIHSSAWLILRVVDARALEQYKSSRPARMEALNLTEESEHHVDLQVVHPNVSVHGVVTVYVDDIAVFAPLDLVRLVGNSFDQKFSSGKVLVLGIDAEEVTHLGLQITCAGKVHDKNGEIQSYTRLYLHQTRYIDEISCRHPELFSSTKSTPAPADGFGDTGVSNTSKDEGLVKRLQQVGGAILWLVVKTRPDIAWAYSKIASLQSKQPRVAWSRLAHLCNYLASTSDLGILIEAKPKGETDLEIHADISFAPNGERSHCGVVAKLRGGCVTWRSFRQGITALSTCEAELIAAVEALETGRILQLFLSEIWREEFPPLAHLRLQESVHPFKIACDNQAAIAQALKGNQAPFRTRHISMRGFRLAEALEQQTAVLTWVESKSQAADYLTKSVPGPMKDAMVQILGMARVVD
eukprot:6492739-Amphidinium_carterae.1